MIPLGPLVNGAAIVVGGLVGLTLHGRFPDRVRVIMFQALGLSILLIGLKMALSMDAPLLVVVSMLAGAVAGEAIDIERWMARAGDRLKARLHSENALFTDGLVTASGRPKGSLCRACFDGKYPIPLPESAPVGKHVLEMLP